jgi:hypothetical protein
LRSYCRSPHVHHSQFCSWSFSNHRLKYRSLCSCPRIKSPQDNATFPVIPSFYTGFLVQPALNHVTVVAFKCWFVLTWSLMKWFHAYFFAPVFPYTHVLHALPSLSFHPTLSVRPNEPDIMDLGVRLTPITSRLPPFIDEQHPLPSLTHHSCLAHFSYSHSQFHLTILSLQ